MLRNTVAVTDVDPRGTRVIVADDDVLMREGLASLLERGGYEVVGRAGDGSELIRLVRECRPHMAGIHNPPPPGQRAGGRPGPPPDPQENPPAAGPPPSSP